MAIPAARLIRDQNLGARFTDMFFEHGFGGAVLGEKTDDSKTPKKGGGLGSRKALNDISNSAKPSAFQVSKKHNANSVIAIDRDIGPSTRTPFGVVGKPNGSKPPQKGKSGGRKALSDVTNSGKPFLQNVANKSQAKNLSVFSEENDIEEEGFLHNHQECSKTHKKIMGKDCLLNLVGLDDGPPFLPPGYKFRPQSPAKLLEMEEMPVPAIDADRVLKGGRVEYAGFCSPARLSPVSPRLSSAHWNSLREDEFLEFTLIESPKHPKATGLIF